MIVRKTPKFRMELKENRQEKNITIVVEKQNTQKFKKFEKQGRRCEGFFFFFQNSFLIFRFLLFFSFLFESSKQKKKKNETITLNISVFYGITDVFTRIESLYPTFVLTRVNLPHVAVTLTQGHKKFTTQQAATAQAEVRSGMSLVDTTLLTKPNMYSVDDGRRGRPR